jgi:hypothetical protein
MASQKLNSTPDVTELWFAKFFIGSMLAIAFLTVVLAFLPSPSGLRNQQPNKASNVLPLGFVK